jgi:hypothetical protein
MGKPANHLPTSNTCEDCHSTVSFASARFDHAGITGNCVSCHNGVTAMGKPANHLPTSNTCEDCHTTISFANARFDHSGVTGNCGTCHNGTMATGKPSNHFVTTLDCADCHTTSSFATASYRHTSPYFPQGHSQTNCTDCHQGNNQAAAWRFPSYQPDCAGCHANDFKTGPHKKVDSPTIYYTVSELRDCTGACHEYADATLTQIRRSRSGEHRASSRDW